MARARHNDEPRERRVESGEVVEERLMLITRGIQRACDDQKAMAPQLVGEGGIDQAGKPPAAPAPAKEVLDGNARTGRGAGRGPEARSGGRLWTAAPPIRPGGCLLS